MGRRGLGRGQKPTELQPWVHCSSQCHVSAWDSPPVKTHHRGWYKGVDQQGCHAASREALLKHNASKMLTGGQKERFHGELAYSQVPLLLTFECRLTLLD